MSMEFINPMFNAVVNSLLRPVKKHLGYLVYSSDKVKIMCSKMTELYNKAKDVKEKKDLNDANNLMVPHHVPGWLEKVKTIREKAEIISNIKWTDEGEIQSRSEIPTGRVGCFNMKTRYKAGKSSFSILSDIERLMTEISNIKWTDEPKPLGKVSSTKVSTSTLVHEDHDGTQRRHKSSRDLIFDDALKSLESDEIKTRMMALSGMGGVGKTTMMEQLEKAVRDRKTFNWIVKVVMGQNHNLIEIQKTIATFTGMDLRGTDKHTRADELKTRFQGILQEGKKKILVILDDVWEKINLEDIGLSSPLPNGFKLLLISRDENVCTQMGVETSLIFKIGVMEYEEAKKLFWETTRLGSDSDIEQPDMYQIGDQIQKICGGLPLAITTIASTLRENKEKYEWEDTLSQLHNNKFDDYNIIPIFEISFNNLKNDDLKAVFILSGLFPEDSYIVREDLLRYGWGLKLFQNMHTIAVARRRVNTCVNKLIRSNLLIKSDEEGCVKMHDVVRDFVLSNFSNVKQASGKLKEGECYDRILLRCRGMFELPADFNHPNLSLLMLVNEPFMPIPLSFPEDFYTRMKELKVVSYENMSQPLRLQPLTNLRALCLSRCSLVDDDISSLGDLVNLEVLSLAYCRIKKLPSKIGRLKRLLLLDLTGCVDICIEDGVFQNLDKLEELYMRASGDRFTDANCKELKTRKLYALELEFIKNEDQLISVSFENLERFRISVGCWLNDGIKLVVRKEYAFKNTLNLVTSKSVLQKFIVNELFKKTEILRLEVNDMDHLKDVSSHPQNSFCNLKSLYVCNCGSLIYLFTIPVAEGLRQLESLVINSCHVLKSVVNGENCKGEVIKFHKLKFLSLNNLPELVSLCEHVNGMELPQLVELKISELSSITSFFPGNNINISTNHPFFNTKVVIPKLEKLKIVSMENLKEVWPCEIISRDEEVNNVFMLRKIKVRDCDSLVNLFPSNPMRLLSHLEYLTVQDCHSIEVLFNIDLGKIEQLSSNSTLKVIDVDELNELRWVWRIKDVVNYYSSPVIHGFQAVEFIHISNCKRFRNIMTPSTANIDMRALQDIKIVCCGEYGDRKNKLIEDSQEQEIIKYLFSPLMMELLSNLKTVYVSFCDGMEEVVSNRDDEEMTASASVNTNTTFFPNLDILQLEYMDNLKHIGGGIAKGTANVIHGESECSQVGDVSWSLCQYSKEISISDCKALSSVIPSYTAGRMEKLQVLSIYNCTSMMEVFETKETNINGSSTSTTLTIPRPTNSIMHKLPNLKQLTIYDCDCLEYIFTFSTLESLRNLRTLQIINCKAMKMIVREEYGTTSSKDVVFPRLKSIELNTLPSLEGFFLGVNTDFRWPLLEYARIRDCPQIITFTSGQSTAPKLKYVHTELGKHNPECGFNVMPRLHETTSPSLDGISLHPTILQGRTWSFHNLIEYNLDHNYRYTKIFPSSELQHLQKLETIHADGCQNVEEVFEVAMEVTSNESQTVFKFPKLREVDLEDMWNLKRIWKSNQGRILEFPNLTRLSIIGCHELEHVFTCSMVGCVMQLQELHIEECRNMKVIVKEEEDYDFKAIEIKFPCLKSLKLDDLECIKGFYLGEDDFTFPTLDTLVIKQCREITVFTKGLSSTPKLSVVETGFGSFDVGENINSFIITKKQVNVFSFYY